VSMVVHFLLFCRFRRVALWWAAVIGRRCLLGCYPGVGGGARRGSASAPTVGYGGSV
jgi:hypothetical protein